MLAAAPFIIILAAWAADKLWPLPLQEVNPARVVVAQDGTPLWRFADADGIWRYPVTIEDVSPRYLEALINYEDRWFWKHPGVNPFSVARAAWQDLTSGRVISGGSTLTMQVARLLDPVSWEKVLNQMPGLQIVPPQSAEVFRDDKVDLPALNGSQHSL